MHVILRWLKIRTIQFLVKFSLQYRSRVKVLRWLTFLVRKFWDGSKFEAKLNSRHKWRAEIEVRCIWKFEFFAISRKKVWVRVVRSFVRFFGPASKYSRFICIAKKSIVILSVNMSVQKLSNAISSNQSSSAEYECHMCEPPVSLKEDSVWKHNQDCI